MTVLRFISNFYGNFPVTEHIGIMQRLFKLTVGSSFKDSIWVKYLYCYAHPELLTNMRARNFIVVCS